GYDDKVGYVQLIEELKDKYPLSEPQIVGEKAQKDFIGLFGTILRTRNILVAFDEFEGKEILTQREMQDYLSRYNDLYEDWRRMRKTSDKVDINDDIVFEIELIKQIEVNIDYILLLIKKYHDGHMQDKEILISIHKAVDSSLELRSKKKLIETFIEGINDVEDVLLEWKEFVAKEKEKELSTIIAEEKLKSEETRKFVDRSFRDGIMKTSGTDVDKIMPPISRFGGERAKKKEGIIQRLLNFFEKFFGIA
ncbi:MAG TPA: type I restriction endonuclease subunit R, partial [Candidatus Ornithoclostridium faecigallinarum]|nr:type I restriction endonuclease subunit R [Candidatus Ornithoclostridium faecigallinarum]